MAWVSIQLSEETNMPLVDGYATHGLIRFSGSQPVARQGQRNSTCG
ncbi:hypothetical protein [Defluviimonas sp. WL0075]|uniref:Uncharacterized protein n=1 Tax=Albidovulum sediminicola TaxID=2984331 RepID=A0ABT2Z295_9RHOB|nr:hypothetical protein [Defluviimonas sp. WL0075]MCV2865244.1 hypothetical protein [Defluviimonas sp. WL0075]